MTPFCNSTAYWFFPQAAEENELAFNSSVYINLDNIHLVQGEGGEKKWELRAEKSKYFKDGKEIKVYRPTVSFYLKNSTQELTMNAPLGIASLDKSAVELQNGVNATYQGGNLLADRMYYKEKEGKIVFRGGVTVNREDLSIKSERAGLDLEKKSLVFERNVEVFLRDPR